MTANGKTRRPLEDRGLCNCIVFYDWNSQTTDLKGWFHYMDSWADHIGMPWESIGITTSRKLLLYKNGKRKLEKTNFEGITEIEIMGGVEEPGTNLNWKTYSVVTKRERSDCFLAFPNDLIPFQKQRLLDFMKNLLCFANFKYGIAYQRGFDSAPAGYAGGALGGKWIPLYEEDKISKWMREYGRAHDGDYRTGLLRDVYPFNILIDQHLSEKVGHGTLESWILSDPTHGTLEKITDQHWLWSIDPGSIPHAQETLQAAGLLLCYKPFSHQV